MIMNESGSRGPDVPMYGTIYGEGENYANATNTLYVACQPTEQGTYKTAPAVPGGGCNYTIKDAVTGNYHVLLDPAGPLATGCDGWGEIRNPNQ